MKTKISIMKKVIAFSLLIMLTLVISCGPSADEKQTYNDAYVRGKEGVEKGEENNYNTLEYMALNNTSGSEHYLVYWRDGYEDGYNKKPSKYPSK